MLAKIGLVLSLVDLSKLEEKFPSHRFVETFVVPNAWPWWQITLGTDALLTFCLLFFADAALARIDGEQAWREDRVTKTASSVSFVRAALSIATISHFFFIALASIAPASLRRLLGR